MTFKISATILMGLITVASTGCSPAESTTQTNRVSPQPTSQPHTQEPAAGEAPDSKVAHHETVTLDLPDSPCCCESPQPGSSLTRVDQLSLQIPDVPLVDQLNRPIRSEALFGNDGPVVVQFFFTTCTTLCPVLTGSMAGMQEKVTDGQTRFISISIDPQNDTPDQLKSFAENFEPGDNWYLVTGHEADISRIQKAFNAFQQNKMQHQPLTFIRATPSSSWTRLDGLIGAEALHQEFQKSLQLQ